ncbi:MAG: hypothetical protein L6R38_005956 [Xanthoria sp. 2 TBL-2021]|nr:MAG: hypothetical protein L6R38_005956 [Xanthoria sp. 2 TBL-2021]
MDNYHFFSFPNEILCRIIDELDSEDTASFALSSKAMYNVSRRAIEKHRAQKYSLIRLGPPDCDLDLFEGYHPLIFLDKILADPRLASYVLEIRIQNCSSNSIEGHYGEDAFIQIQDILRDIMAKRKNEIATLGAECSWLSEGRREEWRDALSSIDSQPHFVGILLTMLPNLESITMTSMSYHHHPITEIVDTVAAANRTPDSPMHGKALTKLLEISLHRSDSEFGENFGIYAPFTTLPSMRSIHGRMISEDHDQSRVQPLRNDIEEIKIIFGAVDLGSWEWMLKSIKNLRRFGYYHFGSMIGNGTYDSRGIVALLRRYSCHSLRRLDLTTSETDDSNQANPYIGDLKDFKVLRILRLDDTSFQTSTGQVMRLVDMLPVSIRVVRLLREVSGEAVDLFEGLAEGKQQGLPELKRVHLEGKYELPSGLVERCRKAAIEISGRGLILY